MTYKTYLVFVFFIFLVALGAFVAARANTPPALVESSPQPQVAIKGAKSAYDLIEQPQGGSVIAQYQPVTISHTVQKGDSLASIATKYHADAQTIVDYPYNEIGDDLNLKVGQILIIPNGYIDQAPPPPPVAKGSGVLAWPTLGPISQYAYWWHAGAIDITADLGTAVHAADNGKVVKVEKLTTGYGWYVILDHENGKTTLYAHLSRINVEIGQSISNGQVIGLVGSTGRSTGPHLHFETRLNGQPVDPMTLLPSL